MKSDLNSLLLKPDAKAPGLFLRPAMLESLMDKPDRSAPPPCRLYGFLASEASVGVLLRRGPSKQVQLIKWNTDNDTFEPGQWFKGRVYEHRSDLSTDGAVFLYHARKEDRKPDPKEKIGYDWIALSKPPYFTALAVWGWGVARSFYNGVSPYRPNKGSTPSNWKFQGSKHAKWKIIQAAEVHEKEIPSTSYALIRRGALERPWDSTTIRYHIRIGSQEEPITGIDWADIDHRGRLVFTRGGKVFACESILNGIEGAIELADFNASTFEPIEAPEWAKAW